MKKKAFIFDLDGVIVDTAKYHYMAWQKIASSLNINFIAEHNELLKGVSRERSLEIILELGDKVVSTEQRLKLLDQKNKDYLSYLTNLDQRELLPDVLKTLQFITSKQQGIALGSASKNARIILEKTGIFNFFDAIVDGNDVSNAKPDPEVFLKACKLLNIHPENAIVFEDSVAGIQAANNAEMISIGIGQKNILSEAKFVFQDFSQITTHFLEELINS